MRPGDPHVSLLDFMPLYIPCGISFSSDWYFHEAGISMAEEVMRDPARKLAAEIARVRHVEHRFPRIFMPGGVPRDEATIKPSLGYGVTTLAAALGARIRFDPHLDPTPVPAVDITKVNILNDIKVPDLHDALGFILDEIDEYVDMGFKKGEIGFFNNQGPLNIAVEAFGDRQVLSLVGRRNKEAEVRHLLDVTSEVFLEGTALVHEALGRPRSKGPWTIAGCTYVYLSPRQWLKYVVPVIEKCVERAGPVGLHHCGVASDDQIDAYATITWMGLEFGFGTDIARVRQVISNPALGPLNISCRVSPYRMLNQPAARIVKDVEWLIEKGRGGPQRIAVVGCPFGTPDENVHALWDTVEAHNKHKAEELEDA